MMCLNFKEIEQRQCLFDQFRKWRRLKRNKYQVVVTMGAKREMTKAEEEGQKKLNQRTKLEHAKAYRKKKEKKLLKAKR